MSGIVTIFGGSGFVGRYIVRRLAKDGWRIRVAVRKPEEAGFVRPYGVVGQVEPMFCNIRDDDSVRAVTRGAEVVVNCVGTFDERGRNNFDAVHVEGATRIARIAAELGVARMVHLSALGASADSASLYAASKAAGEAGVLKYMPGAMILRPSVIFGTEDRFFNRFAGMTRLGPVLPLIGGETRFQPVWVDDVAAAAVQGVTGAAPGGIYELGGPDVVTLRQVIDSMLGIIRRRRLVMNLPFGLARLAARLFRFGNAVTLGILPAPVTVDQVRGLAEDNVVSPGARGFADLGITPVAFEAVVPDYLWRFRPQGQYAAIQESARNLKA